MSVTAKKPMDEVDMIMAYEQGELGDKQTLEFFSGLIKSGRVWQLQGHYGRTASALIADGWIDKHGNINTAKVEANGIE